MTPALWCFGDGHDFVTTALWCFGDGHDFVTPSLCCFPIGFRNSREFREELDDRMGSQTSINSITSYNSGIPRNSVFLQLRNKKEFRGMAGN
jgi:hypothetical protein